MATPAVRVSVSAARGESFSDVARRVGTIGDVVVDAADTDGETLAKVAEAAGANAETLAARDAAAASAALLPFSSVPTSGVVRAFADDSDNLALAIQTGGSVLLPDLRRPGQISAYDQIDGLTARLDAIEALESFPANIVRLKTLAYTAPGEVLVQASSDFVSLDTSTDAEVDLISDPRVYDHLHPFVRRLGGPWEQSSPTTYPGNIQQTQKNVLYASAGDPEGGNAQVELLIDENVTEIEWKGNAIPYLGVQIDGEFTANDGHVPPVVEAAGYRATRLTLSAAAAPRRVRLYFFKDCSFGEVRVNKPGRLLDARITNECLIAVPGDSITEGALATRQFLSWSQRLQNRLGVDQTANMGVGAIGWTKEAVGNSKFSARIPLLLTLKNGGRPDACIIALGLNDPFTTTAEQDALKADVYTDIGTLRAGAPEMPIIVLGPFGTNAGYGATLQAKRDAIFAEAEKYNLVTTVDVAELWSDSAVYETWYVHDGGVVDTTHPNDAGHDAISEFVLKATIPIFQSL